MSATLDLANLGPDAILELWEATRRVHEARAADPTLRRDILHRVDDLEDRDLAEQIRRELDDVSPAAVLAEHWRAIIPNVPALGAFPRSQRDAESLPTEHLAEEPRRLGNVVVEMARFSSDWLKIADSAAQLADEAGIAEDVADTVIAGAIRTLRQGQRHVG